MGFDGGGVLQKCSTPGCKTRARRGLSGMCTPCHKRVMSNTSDHTLMPGGLTDEQIAQIKKMALNFKSMSAIGRELKIDIKTVKRVLDGKYVQKKQDESIRTVGTGSEEV